MRSADVVVIGAGVIGASVAYHLAARGCADVVKVTPAFEPLHADPRWEHLLRRMNLQP
jgi:glycine/D-amino acid oxidase-like deaminating enzyme